MWFCLNKLLIIWGHDKFWLKNRTGSRSCWKRHVSVLVLSMLIFLTSTYVCQADNFLSYNIFSFCHVIIELFVIIINQIKKEAFLSSFWQKYERKCKRSQKARRPMRRAKLAHIASTCAYMRGSGTNQSRISAFITHWLTLSIAAGFCSFCLII